MFTLKNQFLKEIIANDFAFTKEQTSLNHLSGQIVAKKINFGFVSPHFLIRDLSVWVKSLSHLKKTNGKLTVLVNDNSVYELFTLLIREANLQKKVLVLRTVQHLKKTPHTQNLVLLDNLLINRNFFHAIKYDLFLATHFSVEKTKQNFGRYRIFSNIAGFNKIIFIFLILKSVFGVHEKK